MTFVFRPRTHDRGEKVVLGSRITAGGGIEDGLRVLDLLARHPSTSRFIARKLCMRFVADEPPAELVDRTAATFTRTGGDIREVVRTILTSSEFYAPASYRRKIKSPLEYAASAIRATGASTDGAVPLGQWVARMGEPLYLYQAPTGYSEESARWINHATLIERMNFALALTRHRIDGTRLDLSRLVAFETFANAALDPLIALLIHSDVSTGTRAALTRAIAESATRLDSLPDERARRKAEEEAAAALVALLLGAQEFQVK